jgi:hypothetical protein
MRGGGPTSLLLGIINPTSGTCGMSPATSPVGVSQTPSSPPHNPRPIRPPECWHATTNFDLDRGETDEWSGRGDSAIHEIRRHSPWGRRFWVAVVVPEMWSSPLPRAHRSITLVATPDRKFTTLVARGCGPDSEKTKPPATTTKTTANTPRTTNSFIEFCRAWPVRSRWSIPRSSSPTLVRAPRERHVSQRQCARSLHPESAIFQPPSQRSGRSRRNRGRCLLPEHGRSVVANDA